MLEQKMNESKAYLILRGIAYKLFSSQAEYGDKFRGMKEVILDRENLEATAQINSRLVRRMATFSSIV